MTFPLFFPGQNATVVVTVTNNTGKSAVLYGFSRDSLASHGKFRNKYSLNFPLLSDDGLAMEVKAVEWLGYESLITADLVDVGAAQRSARGDGDTNEDSGTIGTVSLVGDAVVDANDPEQVGATRRRVILRANGRVDARNGKIIRATPQAGAVQLFDADTGVHL